MIAYDYDYSYWNTNINYKIIFFLLRGRKVILKIGGGGQPRFLGAHQGLLYVSVGNLVGAIITGGFWLLLATMQTPDQYGISNYGVALSSFTSFIVLLGLNTVVTTYIAKGSTKISVEANQIVFISSMIAAVVLGILNGWPSGVFVIGMTFWMMSLYEALGRKLYRQYAIINIGARASQFVVSLALFSVLGTEGIILGFIISFFVFSFRYFASIRSFNFRQFSEIRSLFKFAMHSYSLNMSNGVFMFFDKIVILPLFGVALLGLYQIGFQFLMFLGMIPISFYQYLLPEQSSSSSTASTADSTKKMSRVRMFGFLLSVGLAAIFFVTSPMIIHKFFPKFGESVDVLRILSIGIIPMMVVWNLNSKFMAMNRSRIVAIGSAAYLIVQVGLMYLLGFSLGAPGVAMATDIALAGQAAILFISSRSVRAAQITAKQ